MKVYLDANVFIYAATDTGRSGICAVQILEAVQAGKVHALTSVLTLDEITFVVKKLRDLPTAITLGKSFLQLNNLEIAPATIETAAVALEAMEQYSFLPRDALHYATARMHTASVIVTEDQDFNKIQGLKRFSIKEFASHISE